MKQQRTEDMARLVGEAAGRAFAEGFARHIPRGHHHPPADIRTLKRQLAQLTARR